MRPAALLLVSLASAPIALAQPEPAPTTVLIVGGGKTPAEAEKARAALVSKVWFYRRQRSPAWPQVRRSDDIPGLKPGLYVALAGMCRHELHNEGERKALVAALKTLLPGSYARTVRGAHGDPCPSLAALELPSKEEASHRAAVDAAEAKAAPLLAYARFLQDEGRLEEASWLVDEVLATEPGHEEARALARLLMVLLTD